jgi:hypothetical protein
VKSEINYEQIYNNLMNVSDFILEKILTDRHFRMQTALALGVTERNVHILATKNSDNLTKFAAYKFYRSTGLKEKDIFAP